MLSFLTFGFLLGLRHALEADHIATVASLVSQTKNSNNRLSALKQGLAWGIGHSLALLVIGSAVVLMGTLIPENIASNLEAIVGVMMVLLGIDVMIKCYRANFHFHIHKHEDGHVHMHGHSHSDDDINITEQRPHQQAHEQQAHHHHHQEKSKLPLRALLIGVIHGMAGSAALLLLFVDSIDSIWQGILYILMFSFGSILGMLLFSIVISVPLKMTANKAGKLHYGLQMFVGILTCGIGGNIIVHWL